MLKIVIGLILELLLIQPCPNECQLGDSPMTCTFTTEDNYPIILYSLVKGVVFIQCMPNVDDYDFFFLASGLENKADCS